MRFTTSQTSFKSGRLSPKLFNRVDTKQYRDGASVMDGFRILPEGGAENIKGSRHIKTDFYSPLVGFEESKTIAFQINGVQWTLTIRSDSFNEVRGYLLPYPYTYGTGTDFLIQPSGPLVVDPDLFDWAILDNRIFLTHFSGKLPPYIVRFNEDGTLDFGGFWAPTSIYSLPMSDLQETTINIANHNPGNHTVEITSADPAVTALLQQRKNFYAEGRGFRKNVSDSRDYHYVASNYYRTVSVIAGGIVATYLMRHFDDNDPAPNGNEALLFAGITSTDVWAYSEFGGGDDFPKTVAVHDGRLVYGGTRTRPLTLFGSRVGNPFFFNQIRLADTLSDLYKAGISYSGGIIPTDPYVFGIATKTDSEITVIRAAAELFVGTDRTEYLASGGDTIMSALSVKIDPYTHQGSHPGISAVLESSVVYTDATRKKLFSFKFNRSNGSYVSQELSLLFNDLMEDDFIAEVEWIPHIKGLYILTDNEKLYAITYDTQGEVIAFYDTLQRNVTSITYVAAREDQSNVSSYHRGDHVFGLRRGVGFFSFEQVFFELGIGHAQVDMAKANQYFFLENAFDIRRVGVNSYSFNGNAIAPAADFFPVYQLVGFPVVIPFIVTNVDTGNTRTIDNIADLVFDVGSGYFLLDDPDFNGASKVIVGELPVPKVLATMPVEAGQQWGSAQMGIKNIDSLGIRHYKSYSYEISNDGETWQEVVVADSVGNLTTGRKETKFSGNPDRDMIVWIRQTKPEPLTITGINMKGVTNDG